jgi:hypothetical protein
MAFLEITALECLTAQNGTMKENKAESKNDISILEKAIQRRLLFFFFLSMVPFCPACPFWPSTLSELPLTVPS